QRRAEGPYRPWEICILNPAVRRVMDAFKDDRFSGGVPGKYQWIYDKLLSENEPYYHLADLASYLEAQEKAAALYRDRTAWAGKAILNVTRVGKFSSDRTIREYARDIWGLAPVRS